MAKAKEKEGFFSFINHLKGFYKLLIALFIGAAAFFIFPFKQGNALTHIMISWDAFCLILLMLSWYTFVTSDSSLIRKQSSVQDETRVVIFLIVLIATLASMTAVILILVSKSESNKARALDLPVALGGMMLSWLVVHTIFALRYAHIFYGNDKEEPKTHAGGLDFPGDEKPDYLDFAYFSFVLGMTFQVSDVQVKSKRLRHLALIHGLISFGYNTIVVALTINVVASLSSS